MEDQHLIVQGFCGRPDMHLLAVFDGHRGAQVAEYARLHFPAVLRRCCADASSPQAALLEAFLQLDAGAHALSIYAAMQGADNWWRKKSGCCL